jgi:ankyrin repeat protein
MKRINPTVQARWLLLPMLAIICTTAASADQLLVEAVREQDTATVRNLIEGNADVNEAQSDGATALHWAAYHDDLQTANLLIEAGAKIDAANDFGIMPLSLACTNGSAPMIEALLKAGADPNAAISTGETPLMTVARSGELDAVLVLLDGGANINAKEPSQDQTAVMWAISEGRIEVARELVKHGADIHAATKREFTPLLFAVREGDAESAKMLLDAGADVNATAKDNKSALLVATLRGHADIAAILLAEGADPNAEGPGYMALHWAVGSWETELTGNNGIVAPAQHEWSTMSGVKERKFDLVKNLLDHGANPNALLQRNPARYGYTVYSSRPRGSTPFMLAAMAGETGIMRMLVDYGADPLLAAENGVTPLMMAAGVRRNLSEVRVPESDSLEAVKLAVELGADVNAADTPWGDTALHGATRIKSADIVQFLVDNGAEVNVVNKRGQSPLFLAERHWPLAMTTIFKPSAAGDLLRELTTPNVVSNALAEWGTIPSDIRIAVESLLQEGLEKVSNIEDSRNENPLIPISPSQPNR